MKRIINRSQKSKFSKSSKIGNQIRYSSPKFSFKNIPSIKKSNLNKKNFFSQKDQSHFSKSITFSNPKRFVCPKKSYSTQLSQTNFSKKKNSTQQNQTHFSTFSKNAYPSTISIIPFNKPAHFIPLNFFKENSFHSNYRFFNSSGKLLTREQYASEPYWETNKLKYLVETHQGTEARNLFNSKHNADSYDYLLMLRLCIQENQFEEIPEMLKQIVQNGIQVNGYHFKQIIHGAKKAKKYELALSYFEKFQEEFEKLPQEEKKPCIDCCNQAILTVNSIKLHPQKAFDIFQWAKVRNLVTNSLPHYFTLNSALSYIVDKQIRHNSKIMKQCLDIYEDIKQEGFVLNSKIYYRMINILTRLGALNEAEIIFQEMLKNPEIPTTEKWHESVVYYLFLGYSKQSPQRLAPYFKLIVQKYDELGFKIPIKFLNTFLFKFYAYKHDFNLKDLIEKSTNPEKFESPNAETLSQLLRFKHQYKQFGLEEKEIDEIYETAKNAASQDALDQIEETKQRLDYFAQGQKI